MKSLVEALLVLARADAGRLELRCEKFDLKEAAEECVAMAASQARDANVRMELDLRSIPIEADRIRLCQLMTNLLSNGIRYNREGGSVRLSINSVDGDAVIAVADTGVGIAAEDQPRIFERFFRTDKARSREAGGSGLGLAICQSIVEAHAGKITFTSQAGVGTTFTARVPRIRAEAEMKG
jgi:signal transduction histidine kinase